MGIHPSRLYQSLGDIDWGYFSSCGCVGGCVDGCVDGCICGCINTIR